jgi:hypothetical protein
VRVALVRGCLLALGLALPGAAGAACRLALVLALDVSSSVDASEDRLQREGLAKALLAPEVVRAFLAGDPVALYVFEWSGRSVQVPLLPSWMVVRSEEDLERIAGTVAASLRSRDDSSTAVGAALRFAAGALEAGPDCGARTIDVSGDGIGNDGVRPRAVYWTFPPDVTVNALVIGGERMDSPLVTWFASEVVRGPESFWMHLSGYAGYGEAMRRKLLRELLVPAVSKARLE